MTALAPEPDVSSPAAVFAVTGGGTVETAIELPEGGKARRII